MVFSPKTSQNLGTNEKGGEQVGFSAVFHVIPCGKSLNFGTVYIWRCYLLALSLSPSLFLYYSHLLSFYDTQLLSFSPTHLLSFSLIFFHSLLHLLALSYISSLVLFLSLTASHSLLHAYFHSPLLHIFSISLFSLSLLLMWIALFEY